MLLRYTPILMPWILPFSAFQIGFKGFGLPEDKLNASGSFIHEGREFVLRHGSVVIAAITSCTNTSNPSVMLGAGMFEISLLSFYLC